MPAVSQKRSDHMFSADPEYASLDAHQLQLKRLQYELEERKRLRLFETEN